MANNGKNWSQEGTGQSQGSPERGEIPFHIDVKKIRRGILRHIPLIILSACIFALIGGYFSYRLLHTYKAQAVLIYQERVPKSFEQQYQVLHLTLPSAIEMITLSSQLRTVKSILGLDLSVEDLQGMVQVKIPMRESNLITIAVNSDDPQLAVDIANTLANVSVKHARELNRKQWQAAYAYFKNQEEVLNNKLQDQMRSIADFRKQYRFIGMDVMGISSLSSLREAEDKLQKAKLDYQQMLVEYENLNREYAKIPDQLQRPLMESSMQTRMAQLEMNLLDAKSHYAPENPKVKALEYQLSELQKIAKEENGSSGTEKYYEPGPLKEKLNLELIGLQAKLSSTLKLKEEMEDIVHLAKEKASTSTDEQVKFANLLNRKEAVETDIKENEIMKRAVDIVLHLGKGDLEVYQAAETAKPRDESLLVDLLPTVGFLFGALFGMIIAAFIEIFDRKIRTANQVEAEYHLPCLVTIPESHRMRREGGMLNFIRALSDRILLQKSSFHSLIITSSIEGEGKSLIAAQLAQYYKRIGKRVVLVELDYRPSKYFGELAAGGKIEDFLRGKCSVEELVIRGDVDRLTTGYDSHMKELIQKEPLSQLWSYLNQQYELIIVDAPGIISEEYAVNIASLGDCCLYVIGSNKVTKNYIDQGLEILKIYGIQPVGIVLNRVKSIYVDDLRVKSQQQSNIKRKGMKIFNVLKKDDN